jgi:hypothetical protein
MDFDTYYNKLNENVDTTNYIEKYKNFGQKLKEIYNISSHEDSFVEIKMAAYFNSGILYKFYFRTINKSKTLKKILKLVNNKVFELKTSTETTPSMTVVEVAYLFKDIERVLSKQTGSLAAVS